MVGSLTLNSFLSEHWPTKTSFSFCPSCPGVRLAAPPTSQPMPTCLSDSSSSGCAKGPQRDLASTYIDGINKTLATALKDVIDARQQFETRVCDYKIAQSEGDVVVERSFGPDGERTE